MAQENLEKIQKIEKVTEKASSTAMEFNFEPETRLAPNREHFDQLMTQPVTALDTEDVRKVTTKKSMVEEVASIDSLVDRAQRGSPQALVAQAEDTIKKMEELKEKLKTPNLDIQSSVQEQLRNKLMHIDDNLKIALNRSGIEYNPPPPITPEKATPIERFLGYLTDSQQKINTLTDDINRFAVPGAPQMSPATMLVLQMKVGIVQQEVELFSALLNKSLESTKTIMNVQV